MDIAVGLVILVAAGALLAAAARQFRVSEPLVLTLAGVAGSYLPFVPDVALTSDLVLLGLLPPLLYTTAIRTSLVDFKANRRSIGLLSVGLVLFTAFGVGLVAWLLLPVPFAAAVALGAVVAPPDAVAATAIARRVGMPRRVVTILEGESLFNDATALVTLRTAIAASAGSVTVLHAAGDFLLAAGGGVAIGVGVALVLGTLRRRITDPVLDTTVSFLAPFLAFLPAEKIHASGVIAVVVAGLILGHRAPVWQSAASRIAERTNWRTVDFLLENSVFLLIGLQVRVIVDNAWRSPLNHWHLIGSCLAILATAMLLRPLWVFPAVYLPRKLSRRVREADPAPPWRYPAVISWAGMRGVVTLAAVFLLPADIPYRDVLVLAALVVVGGTLLLQGATLPWVVHRLELRGPSRAEDALQEAGLMQQVTDAGLRALEEHSDEDTPAEVIEGLRHRVGHQVNAAWERLGPDESDLLTPSEHYRRLRLVMLQAEREELLKVRDSGVLDHEVLQAVMRVLDLEESLIDRFDEGEDELPRDEPLRSQINGNDCEHLEAAPLTVRPDTPGRCQECEDEGLSWVHLRMCLTCGHVACCDSSDGKHADKHYSSTEHPVMRSVESGEAWRWCYVDSRLG
ncbi:MAG TPA: Na+/H+ antiporter [Jatrophihabitans sp.]|uniref:Na+/H+ antiporter n=1 Tax=Jatrophihabitans sp. TaxID=1932789 RepID=UPI002F0755AB